MEPVQRVALGEAPADTVVRGGRVVQVLSGAVERRDVAVVDGTIAAQFEDATPVVGPETTVVDATGGVVVPGFVDAHAHMDHDQTLERTAPHVLAGGTTTLIEELTFTGANFGARAVAEFLALDDELPLDVRPTVPPQELFEAFEPAHADGEGRAALIDCLEDDRVVGAGETGWIYVVGRDSGAGDLYRAVRERGKRVVGHGAGASGRKLAAFATVATIDHEVIAGDEVLERLENGIHVVGRFGTTRDDIDAVVDAYERVGPAGISLGTDGVSPGLLLEEGYMDAVLREAIDRGVDPVDAVRMGTVHTAEHFGLDRKGVLAPGYDADLVVLDDLETVDVDTVLAGGEMVVTDGTPDVGPWSHDYPVSFYDSIHLTPDPAVFEVEAGAAVDGEVRAIRYERELATAETTVEPAVGNGHLHARPDANVAKATIVDRHPDGEGRGFTGFVEGFGIEHGAVATSLSVERTGVVVLGTDEGAMETALRRVKEMGGGWVTVDGDGVDVAFPTPVAGVCTEVETVREAADRYEAVEASVRSLGVDIDRPLFGLQCLCHPGVPAIRLTFSGYADILGREVLGLSPEE
jgi:adenine deaminase